jgi:hypothetical protein
VVSSARTAVTHWLRCCASNRKVAGSIPAGVIVNFHWNKILPIGLWPWGRLSLQQKLVPGTFPGSKGGRCVGLTTLPPSCAVVMKSGNLNFLEASGPLQACDGTALPLPLLPAYLSCTGWLLQLITLGDTHSHTLVGIPWTGDHSVAEASTCTTHNSESRPCLGGIRVQFQQASGGRHSL